MRINPADPASALEGKGRFNLEVWTLDKVGIVNAAKLTPVGRETAQFFFDGFFPFVVMLIVSLFTKRSDTALVTQFYGKMKTPVGPSPEQDLAEVEETRRNPARFDHTKLLGAKSSWEFCKWTRQDAVGFLACFAVSWGIVGAFVLVLKFAAN